MLHHLAIYSDIYAMIHFEVKQDSNIMYKLKVYQVRHSSCFLHDVKCACLL